MEWISVKDRLPKKGQIVDLWVTGDQTTIAFYDTTQPRGAKFGRTTSWVWDGARWCATQGLQYFLQATATHWMPLPAPPEEPHD